MGLLDPTPPPYAPLDWLTKPFLERARIGCEAWAIQGYGAPPGALLLYAVKVAVYIGAWIGFVGMGRASLGSWWLLPVAYQKAIVWSMLFEVLGLGCGSGPLSGRYFPPFGGFLYFLRPGTTKLPLWPRLPVLGGAKRTVLDVLLYAALLASCLRALLTPAPGPEHFWPLVVLVPLLGVTDKTIFLAARAEHFWVMITCFAAARDWIPGAMIVQLALWFWAGVSKLNHHFPTVACVMTSNSPVTRLPWLRRQMYRDYPRDLRPSRLAAWMAHGGTGLEFAVPIAFLLTPLGTPPTVAIVIMLMLHGYITSNVPMGVPIEWNVIVVYGGFALFWAHPNVSILGVGPPALTAFVLTMTVLLPLLGNLFPAHVSFLVAMRYYAGNWPYSIWLFRGDAYRKLAKMKATSAWIYDQLARFYDRSTAVGLFSKVIAWRMMHLQGRVLPILVPKAIDRLENYEWLDGEIVAGMVLGWNFGEGHLHHEQLLAAVQEQCGFEEGELRCIFVESQPFFGDALEYRIADAKTGQIEKGALPVAELRTRQPWEAPAKAP